jgi:hypothetical protein
VSTTSDPDASYSVPLVPVASVLPRDWSLADLQAHLGGVPSERIRLFPPPGTATIEDALAVAETVSASWSKAYWWRKTWQPTNRSWR